jgi:hypothetical protein
MRHLRTLHNSWKLRHNRQRASTEIGSPHDGDSDRESQSRDSGDSETASNNSSPLKVAVVAALARISYDFDPSKITKIRIGSMESYAYYFPKRYGLPPSTEFVPEPRADEAIILEDFFAAGFVYRCIQFSLIFST